MDDLIKMKKKIVRKENNKTFILTGVTYRE